MKTILPWIVAVLALGGAFYFYKASATRSVEVAKLKADVQQLESARAEVEKLKESQVAPEELVRLRKNTEDLIRLRGEVGRLKNENEQANKQAQAAQGEIQRVQAQALAAQQQAQTLTTNLQQLSAQQQALAQQVAAKQSANACINNLRILDSAMQQWALETGKTAQTVVTVQDHAAIAQYIKGNALPKCPNGGAYTFSSLVNPPTCSIPGHVMHVLQ